MYSIAIAEAPASDDMWAAYTAWRLLDEAAMLAASAEGASRRLARETTWQSKGVRVLRERLAVLGDLIRTERSTLGDLRERLERVSM